MNSREDINTARLPLWRIHILMLFSTVVVSSSFTVGAAITHGLDPAVLLLIRYIWAVLMFAPLVHHKHGLKLPSASRFVGYILISASTVSFFWCMFEALRYTTAINTSIIFTLVPGISGLYSAVFLRERLGRSRLAALFFGMAGALWVIFRGDLQRMVAMEINHGDLLFLLGCFMMAAYTPLVAKFHKKEPMLVMTFWVLVCGMGWLILISIPNLRGIEWRAVSSTVWLGIWYLALFSTIITFYLTHVSTVYLGPTRVMAYSYFYPAFVLLIDWGMGNGLPPLIIWPGIFVVTMATVVLQRGRLESSALKISKK